MLSRAAADGLMTWEAHDKAEGDKSFEILLILALYFLLYSFSFLFGSFTYAQDKWIIRSVVRFHRRGRQTFVIGRQLAPLKGASVCRAES